MLPEYALRPRLDAQGGPSPSCRHNHLAAFCFCYPFCLFTASLELLGRPGPLSTSGLLAVAVILRCFPVIRVSGCSGPRAAHRWHLWKRSCPWLLHSWLFGCRLRSPPSTSQFNTRSKLVAATLTTGKEGCGCLFHSGFQVAGKCLTGAVGALGAGLLFSLKDI